MATQGFASPFDSENHHPFCNPLVSSSPPHWKKATESLQCAHFDEVSQMVSQFAIAKTVDIQGTTLTVARRGEVRVLLDEVAARDRVAKSANCVAVNISRGTDTYGVTTGFCATSHMRTSKTGDLRTELISYFKAGMLVRTNTHMQRYSGIRWEILESIAKIMNENLIPKLPLRGTITASGDLVPLSYIADLLTGRHNSKVETPQGEEITAKEALKRAGIQAPFELQAKEGLVLVNGTAVASAVAATLCFDANILALLAEILSALFCEVMHGKPAYTDPLTHELKHHRGQIEAAAIMKHLPCPSDMQLEPLHNGLVHKLRLFEQPLIQLRGRSILSNDNPLIDVARDLALHGGNFQGTPIGVSMDNLRIAIAAIGKLMFAQFSELVCDCYNNGLPSNLSGGPNPSLDYGFKGAEIAMAAYCSELHAEQHNQDVNLLGLISARKSAEAIEILKLMSATFMVALCQAIDLRHLEENMREVVKQVLPRKNSCRLLSINLYSPISTTQQILLIHFCLNCKKYPKSGRADENGCTIFKRIPVFIKELKARLREEVPKARERFDSGEFAIANRIKKCRTYPIYEFVRSEVGTELLSGEKKVSPGEHIEKVHEVLMKGNWGIF
ncbi:hypothetical protein P3X46_007587 [Hevea brasiliensis]|uniref:phenylalanine ammonia-lyase n=1 Tax=Hevea brasiliensis TaxID=3981 RepID=A0ABQ9MUI1_HEVBR|nr:hypothetical protein P3X46_007587 [Hevea brasiliensis]